ncbi:hypothetical protein [Clostridium estertheticum]|uniref:hypothetical protein n=1 Tax=Clostridium estertheticum TaxID=238834 RepID=UPI001C7D34D0|nr:hypothetical protein [Clostridium estertheticum]MBX4272117.1 hypothetical protein [Clostridium estertheticum]WLC82504.1 hypothetical protein KTC98_24425 [Clostridium estertheticum]
MLYTIAEVSDLINLSKVSIYKKLKLKEMQEHITKKQGITYIDDVGLALIKDRLKNLKKEEPQEGTAEAEKAQDTVLEDDVLTINKELIKALLSQLKEKDNQIHELHRLVENGQILLKDKPQDIKLLEEHFQNLDSKFMDIRQDMQERKKPQKGFLKRMFKK